MFHSNNALERSGGIRQSEMAQLRNSPRYHHLQPLAVVREGLLVLEGTLLVRWHGRNYAMTGLICAENRREGPLSALLAHTKAP